jgi:hypothetical protein
MAQEFDYEWAWRELAGPGFEKLPQATKNLYYIVVALGRQWAQDENLDVVCTNGRVMERFRAHSDRELAVASQTIYFWGHWGHAGDVILRYTGDQALLVGTETELVFSTADFGSHAAALQAAQQQQREGWELISKRNGPDNRAHAGAYWKFAGLANQVLRERLGLPRDDTSRVTLQDGALYLTLRRPGGWGRHKVGWATREMLAKLRGYDAEKELFHEGHVDLLRDHLVGTDPDRDWFYRSFMKHVPGTKYASDELPAIFQPHLEGLFNVKAAMHINHKPHPFKISSRHLKDGQIDLTEPCGERGCALPHDQHTSELALFLQPVRNLTQPEFMEAVSNIGDLMAEHHVDGIALVKHPEGFEITQDPN